MLSFLDFCDQQQVIFHTPPNEAPLTSFPVFPSTPTPPPLIPNTQPRLLRRRNIGILSPGYFMDLLEFRVLARSELH